MTDGKGVDKVIIAGGGVETFAEAVKCLKPGGKIGNVNYLGSGDTIDIPRVEWGVGMGHKQINGGLMPGGRLRMEKLGALVSAGKLDVSALKYSCIRRLGSSGRSTLPYERQSQRI